MTYVNTSYPVAERVTFPPEIQRKPKAESRCRNSGIAPYAIITRPDDMKRADWQAYQIRELSRLRQERNRRGEHYSLNRGRSSWGLLEVVRGTTS